MNDNIKVINLNINKNTSLPENNNKNTSLPQNNNNNSINEIVFNNNNQINENFLTNNRNRVIEENVALENKELIYKDDSVYIQELEKDLLSTYPVTKQNSKYIIEKVQSKAKDIINLKNLGLQRYELLNKNIEYQKKLDILNNDFSDSWIVPIVYDNHNIFTNIIEKNINENNEINNQRVITQLKENSSGFTEKEQKELLDKLKENNKNFEEKKINITNYEEINSKLYKSFITKYEGNKGYLIHPKKSFNVIRHTDLKNNNWNSHKILNDLNTPTNMYDEEGKIVGIEEELLIRGESQNIFGFLLLKEGNKNILSDYNNILFPKNYKNHLYQVLYDKKKIKKIYQSEKQQIKITVEDHNIKDDAIIYLYNTNCYPKIDGYYDSGQNLKIIDKDTIEIKSNKNLVFEGDSGYIFLLSKLKYDYYDVDDNLKLNFLYSNYEDKKEDNNHNKLYIFENIQMNRKKYVNLLSKIIPNIDFIIENEKSNLQRCIYLDDVKKVLDKYYIKLDDLHDKHFETIIKYMQENISKVNDIFKNNKKYEKINYFFENKEYLERNHFYLNDIYLFDKEVVKYYGEYPYKNTTYDSIIQRYNWLKNKDDKGELYIKLYCLKKNENSSNQLKYVENKIKELKNNITLIEKNLKGDIEKVSKCNIYKYSGKKINSLDNDNKINEEYYLYEDKLYQYINTNLEIVGDSNEGDLLLMDNLELWEYKNKKWEFTKEYSKYNKLKYLCEFKNIELSEVELDSLDCIYRKDYGCHSKISVRNKNKLEELKEVYNLFVDLEQKLKNNDKKKNIKLNVKYYIEKYDFSDEKQNNKFKKLNVNIKGINSSIPVDILIKKIFKIKNLELRENYFYQLISKDCLLINDRLYSKKYKKEILCGHYYYFKKIYYSNDYDLRQKFIDIMVSIYSDEGESEKNTHTCKICGEKLLNNDYDESEGFASSGALIMSREKWVKEKSFEVTKNTIEEYLENVKDLDCNDDRFNDLLLKYGLSVENIEKANNLCNFITKTIYPKIGITLPNGVLINNIIEIIQKLDLIIPFQLFRNKEKEKMVKDGISRTRIEKMEEKKYFEQKYKIYIEIKKQAIICSRILISIQVNIPNLVIKNKKTNCEFNSFNEKEGIEFFACLLKELNQKLSLNKEDVLGTYKNFIQEYYDDFKSFYYIKDLFREKKKYLLSLKKEKIYEQIVNKELKYNFKIEPKKIENIANIYKNVKNYNDFKNKYNELKTRNLYVNYQIKDIIQDIISKAPLSDRLGGLIEKSCCSQDVSTYIDFFQYFQLFNEKTQIFNYIEESKKLNEKIDYKLINCSYHRFKFYHDDKSISNNNTIVIYDGKTASDDFKKSIFIQYVNEGLYKGTPRDYVEEFSGIKDVKTGKSLDDIENEDYTIDELNDLLKSIEQNNIKFNDSENIKNKGKMEEDKLNKLKKESINGLKIQMSLLVSNLVFILGKSKDYETKLYNLLMSIKRHSINHMNNNSIKNKINEENSMNNNRLNYYKKLYQKISKYLSIIKNRFEFDKDKKINIINNPRQKTEMKSEIILENSKLDSLLIEEISSKFVNINLKYNLNEINSIFGQRNVLDKDGNKTIKYSDFTTTDSANLMEYIVYEQLNLLFDGKDSDEDLRTVDKSTKNKYIAQFINIILDEMEEEYELFDICNKNNEFEHLDARFYNAYQLKIITSDQKYEIKDFTQKISESTGVSLDNEYNTLEDELKISEEKKNIEDSIVDIEKFDEMKQEYLQSGENNEDLDLIALKHIKDRIDDENEVIVDEDFNSDGTIKNKDIVDMGSDYGGLNEFDFETGDGFPEAEYSYE